MPGYTAYLSNSLKKFLHNYSDRIAPSGLFKKKSIVIVQNKNMEEWLKLEIATSRGIYIGADFMFPDQCIRTIAELSPELNKDLEVKSVVYLDDLKIIIYRILEELLQKTDENPVYLPLKKYVENVSDNNKAEKKSLAAARLYSLSDSIAGLFYHYGFNCPEMIECWERGGDFVDKTEYAYLEKHEKWQIDLWNRLFSGESDYLHLGHIISRILSGQYILPSLDLRIVIFGSSFLSEQSIEFFYHLAAKCNAEVDHFILSPSPGKTAVLSSWSSILDGLLQILAEKNVEIIECFDIPSGFGPAQDEACNTANSRTSLGYIKSLLYGSSPVLSDEKNRYELYLDSSLKIVSAPGKRREIEILKNNIISLVNEQGCSLNEIGVAAPDINSYIPFIESVFQSPDHDLNLQYNLMDIDFISQSVYVKGFFDLIDLSGSRFNRKEIFRLFTNPSFMEKMNIKEEDIEKWLEVCELLLIKWGVNESHKKDILSGLESTQFGTWSLAGDRVAAGFVFDSREEPIAFPDGSAVVPYPLSGYSEEKNISEMLSSVEMLFNDVYSLKNIIMKLTDWTALVERLMDSYLKPVPQSGQENDRNYLKNVFRKINNLDIGSINPSSFPFSVFRIILEEHASKGGHYKGQYLSGGVSFSSLKPLRAIPFKAFFLLGMGFDGFPARERPLSYDLRNVTKRSIDLSREKTDCFAFLETIVSTGEKLVISYPGVNLITGEALDCSPVVSSLEDFFKEKELENIRVRHPLYSFSRVYFSENSSSDYISYDSAYLEAARAEAEAGAEKKPPILPDFKIINRSAAENKVFSADIYDLIYFLKSPLSCFLRKTLSFPYNPVTLAENDVTEKVGLSWAESSGINRELLNLQNADDYEKFIENAVLMMIYEGKTADSGISKIEHSLFLDRNRLLFESLKSKGFYNSLPVKVFFGINSDEPGNEVYPSVSLEGENGALEITGVISLLRRGTESDYYSVLAGQTNIKNLVSHFVNYLMLSFSGKTVNNHDSDISYTVYDSSGGKSICFTPDMPDSREILTVIADSYIENLGNPYVIDSICIEKTVKEMKNNPDRENISKFIKNHYESSSFSDSGYIRGFEKLAYSYSREDLFKLLENVYRYMGNS